MDNLNNTKWNNEHIFKDLNDPKLNAVFEETNRTIKEIQKQADIFESLIPRLDDADFKANDHLTDAIVHQKQIIDLEVSLWTIRTFVQSELSVNAKNELALEVQGKLGKLGNELSKATKAIEVFLKRAPQDFIDNFLKDERTKEMHFQLAHSRKMKDHLLGLKEEVLSSGLSESGLHAWGKLYNSLCGAISIDVDGESLGLASASALLRQGDRNKRELSYKAINSAWEKHEESASSILNGINGWRWEMNRARSHTKELHYLDVSCQQSRITRNTLSTLMETTYKKRDIGHRAMKAMAKMMDLKELAPWDLLAPAPIKGGAQSYSLDEAIDLIADAFSKLNPEMGEFAKMMHKKNWIDSAPSENRGPGAYCTKFPNVREPRVFMTYTGSMGNVITLAHELGHAYHNWVMKDLPLTESFYSMTLAETASIFAETLVKKSILDNCKSDQEKMSILWQDAESAAALLINIPARYEFEKALVEERRERPQTAKEMKELMHGAWEKWYGNTISEYDNMFWASKMHFSISSLGFYNYPYLFGYLFSLGIYGQKDKLGDKFNDKYLDILKDTGVMMAEDLIKKHLGQDIEKEDFWLDSLSIVEEQITTLEKLL